MKLRFVVGPMPLLDELVAAIGPQVLSSTVGFCWDDTVYLNSVVEVPPAVAFHEAIHSRQQKGDPEKWWRRYMRDPAFRYQQELEAYREQWRFVRREYASDALVRARWLALMARDLSSPLYGGVVTLSRAQRAITR